MSQEQTTTSPRGSKAYQPIEDYAVISNLHIGRFGIGLMTLQAPSDTLDLHSGPYHVRFGDAIITAIEPFSAPNGFMNPEDTLLRVCVLGPASLADEAAMR